MDALNPNRSATAASVYQTPPSSAADGASKAEPTSAAGHSDGFSPSSDLADEQPGHTQASSGEQSPGQSSGATSAAQQHDAALVAHSGGEGCGCPACSSANPTAQLEARDKDVKQHEQQHLAEDGADAMGGPSFDTVTGSNGKQYAMGGKVHVNTSEFPGDPQKTIERMQRVKRASLAPRDPSSQDYATAGKASSLLAKAQTDKLGMETQKTQMVAKGMSSTQAAQQVTLPSTGMKPVSTPA